MRDHRILIAIVLVLGVTGIAKGQVPSFQAEIKLPQNQVKDGKDFILATAIRNVGKTDQSIDVYPCTYQKQWISDNPLVHPEEVVCRQNSLIVFKLKPGEAYQRSIFVYVDLRRSEAKPTNVTFRLEYGTKTGLGAWKPWPTIPPIWSNAVTAVVSGK